MEVLVSLIYQCVWYANLPFMQKSYLTIMQSVKIQLLIYQASFSNSLTQLSVLNVKLADK